MESDTPRVMQPGDPTPEEIARACEEIRSTWTAERLHQRSTTARTPEDLKDAKNQIKTHRILIR